MLNPSLITSERPLKAKVVEITPTQAVLVLPDEQKMLIHPKFLPENSKVGQCVFLNFLSEEQLEQKREEVAHAVLEEILRK